MNPELYQNQNQNIQQPAGSNADKKKLTWGLICLITPTALFVIAIIVALLSRVFTAPAGDDALFAQPSPMKSIANIIVYLFAGISILTWLPGIIVGIILLATRKK